MINVFFCKYLFIFINGFKNPNDNLSLGLFSYETGLKLRTRVDLITIVCPVVNSALLYCAI